MTSDNEEPVECKRTEAASSLVHILVAPFLHHQKRVALQMMEKEKKGKAAIHSFFNSSKRTPLGAPPFFLFPEKETIHTKLPYETSVISIEQQRTNQLTVIG